MPFAWEPPKSFSTGEAMIYRKILWAALGLAATAVVNNASAATFLDTSLTNPPGVYFGAGNSNSHFTVDRTGSFELGLSAIDRFLGPITPTGSTYSVPTGPTLVPGKTGSEWGFVFSVNNNYDGSVIPATNADTNNFTYRLTLQDVGLGTTGFFDPNIIPDNSRNAAHTAFQNSEALSFSLIASLLGDPSYNMNADDTYIFTLQGFDRAGSSLASTQITVVAGKGASVPSP
jgi:hypothetical protein